MQASVEVPCRVTGIAQSGRAYDLMRTRVLSPGVALMSPGSLVAKAIRAADEETTRALLAEAAVWASLPESPHMLSFVDAILQPATDKESAIVFVLMPFCQGGHLTYSPTRDPRSVLRIVAGIAAALQVVLSSGLRAHGNISMEHVYLDSRGIPKLAGFGLARAFATPRKETSDVRAIAEILFELAVGEKFRPSADKSLPDLDSKSYPPHTAFVLKAALYPAKGKKKMDLVHFRYELAAARGLLPICDSALPAKSAGPSKSLEFLSQDLNSVRAGVALSQPSRASSSQQKMSVRSLEPRNRSASNAYVAEEGRSSAVHTGRVASQVEGDVAKTSEQGTAENSAVVSAPVNGLSDTEQSVRVLRVTDSQATPYDIDDVKWLTRNASGSSHAQQALFKLLFKRPIGKKPVVAFKALALLHTVLHLGPAEFSLLTAANDGFLGWIEKEWSRESIAGKNSRREYVECVSNGEISLYANFLRHRAAFQRDFSPMFLPNWTVSHAAMESVPKARLSEMFRCVATMQGLVGNLITAFVTANDSLATLKLIVLQCLTAEMASSCKSAFVVKNKIAGDDRRLAISSYIDVLLETIHQSYDILVKAGSKLQNGEDLVRAMRTVIALGDPTFDANTEPSVTPRNSKSGKASKNRQASDKPQKSNCPDDIPCVPRIDEDEENGDVIDLDSVGAQTANAADDRSEAGISTRHNSVVSSQPKPRPTLVRDKPRRLNEEKVKTPSKTTTGKETRARNDVSRKEDSSRKAPCSHPPPKSTSKPPRRQEGLRGHSSTSDSDLSDSSAQSVSSESEDDRPPRQSTRVKARKLASAKTVESRKSEKPRSTSRRALNRGRSEPDSDEDSSTEPSTSTSADDSASEDSSDPHSNSRSREGSRKSKSKRHGQHENGLNHAKEHSRKGRKSLKKSESLSDLRRNLGKPLSSKREKTAVDENGNRSRNLLENKAAEGCSQSEQRGSEAALAAAASGRKTPRMDPRFEIQPHEVRFGNQIGSGGFGIVFRGKFRGETVAIKKIHAHALNNPSSIAEFRSEVAVLCTLQHPNILRFLGACTKPPSLMIITEFMARGTLFELLHQSNTKVTWAMRKKMALDTCKGMRYLHDSKLLHRDLKSSNLMLDDQFNCKVGDFGLTRISSGAVAAQMTGQCGTFQYMAVEVLANKPYSEKADVFSFGVLLWELVARKLPYFGMQPMQVGIAVMHKGLRPTIPERCPAPLAKLIKACWQDVPERRPSFAQIQHHLEMMPDS